MKNIFFSYLFCVFSFAVSNAQPLHTFTQYTTEDGLIQKTISCILQDHKGLLWFSTWDGINRFDGYTFKNYKARPGDLIGLTNNRIDYIVEDHSGNIWMIDYDRRVHCFNPKTESFSSLPIKNYQARQIFILSNGHVWVTTEKDGLLRATYHSENDTLQVDNFSEENHLPPTDEIYKVTIDQEQNEWILTNNGICQIPKNKRNPISYFRKKRSVQQELTQSFYDAVETKESIFFGSNNGQVGRYTKGTHQFSLIKLSTNASVISLGILRKDTLLCGTDNDGFLIIPPDGKNVEHYTTTTHRQLPSNCIKKIYIDKYQEVWMEQDVKGVTLFRSDGRRVEHFTMKRPAEKDASEANPVLYIVEDKQGNVWIHPSGGDFSYYDRQTGALIPFYNSALSSGWDSSNRLTALFVDRQDNIWIGSYTNGLEKVTFYNSPFNLYTHPANQTKTGQNQVAEVGQNNTRALFCDRNGRLWIGYKDKSIAVYDKMHRFEGYLHADGTISPQDKATLGMAYIITQDHEGTIWIGTKGEGLIAARPGKSALQFNLTQYKYDPKNIYSLSHDEVYSIYEDKQGKIWIATLGGGLNYLQPNNSTGNCRFINYRNELKNYPIHSCYRTRFVTSDHQGRLWVATTHGVLSFKEDFDKPEQLTFDHFTRIPGNANSLSNNNVQSIFLSSRNELYMVTFGGGLNKLLSLENGNARFQSYTTREGLFSDILLAIEEDQQGNLWIAMEKELCKFTPQTGKTEMYPERFFPYPIKFNEGTAIRLQADGSLLFNTKQGALHFQPDSIHKSTYTPPIVFTQLQLSNKIILPNDGSGLLKADIDDTQQLTFSHLNNSFSIQFAALDMKYSGTILYAYRLEGFEEGWNEIGKHRVATYTNLPKGDYTLQVRSTNSDGIWTDNTRTIHITILPSFWETPWAILLYVLALIAIILIAVYILFTFYRLKHEVSVEQKLSELKLQFFTNASHELRTPLTLIAGPVEHILGNSNLSSDVREQLTLVDKNIGRMQRLVNQILDLQKIQNKKMKMQVQQIELLVFIRHLMESFSFIAEEHRVDFRLETALNELTIWADVDKLEKILFNLLSNAFKYTPEGKQIKVVVSEEKEQLIISIQDQGIGIAKNKQKNLFKRFESIVDKNLFNQASTGLGLALVKELVEMHKGRVSIESQPGKGSQFTVELLKGKEHFDKETEFILADSVTDVLTKSVQETTFRIPDKQENEGNSTEKETLLIVEDNQELRHFLRAIFLPHFCIVEAENGAIGLEKAKEIAPDIIISDVMMPEMDGIEMIRKLHAEMSTSHIPIVLLTAKSTIESKIEGMELGADDYITKPFSASYLKARIANLLAQRKKLQALYCATLLESQPTNVKEEATPLEAMPPLSANDQKFMEKTMEAIERQLDNGELMIDDLARELGVSRSVFFKKLKMLTGFSPVDFLKEMRIKRAAQLIKAREGNMAQIAYQVGFNDPHYFSKCFKQRYGVTPTEYRES